MLGEQFFADVPLYDAEMFRRRSRMSRTVFDKVLSAVVDHDDYFKRKKN